MQARTGASEATLVAVNITDVARYSVRATLGRGRCRSGLAATSTDKGCIPSDRPVTTWPAVWPV